MTDKKTVKTIVVLSLAGCLFLGPPGCVEGPPDDPAKACLYTGTCPSDGGEAGTDAGGRASSGGSSGATPSAGGASGAGGSLPCDGKCEGDALQCKVSTGECLECLNREHCKDKGEKDKCDAEGNCVACLAHDHCTEPDAAKCHEGSCVPCDDSAQCKGIPGTEACDTDTNKCVECLSNEAAACDENPCNPLSKKCSDFGPETRDVCETCDTDANCREGRFCVEMEYDGSERQQGNCLSDFAAGCSRPFSVQTPVRPTLSGVTGKSFCGVNETLTTCEAVRAMRVEGLECPDGPEDCPVGGRCATVSGVAKTCTYLCEDALECPSTRTCDGIPDDYCGG